MEAEECGGRGRGGDRAFPVPVHGGEVVCVRFGGAFTEVIAGGCNIIVKEAASEFQFAVVDGASRVAKGD